MISTRSEELVIDTVVCLTLAKWETVSGRFGGYLRTVPEKEMIMNCHYIGMQLERIRNAGIGAGAELSSEGSSGLEEQLQT